MPAKEAGKARDEGKEYVVKDGDVMLFKFNTWRAAPAAPESRIHHRVIPAPAGSSFGRILTATAACGGAMLETMIATWWNMISTYFSGPLGLLVGQVNVCTVLPAVGLLLLVLWHRARFRAP